MHSTFGGQPECPTRLLKRVETWPECWRDWFAERQAFLQECCGFTWYSAVRFAYKDTAEVTERERLGVSDLTLDPTPLPW